MKAAVYCGTRNLYKQMIHAAKSLLTYSDVDKIYFIIEDDEFPYELPPEIECCNLSNQTYFRPDGPNYNENLGLTYMVLIRAALTKIFPDLDRILTLDVDTLVRDNISHLWDMDLNDYYLAATREEDLSKEEARDYINMGVAMFNLKKMREDGIDDKIIHALDKYFYRYNEQDCINDFCEGKIKILPSDYNCCWQAKRPSHERIMHFAGIDDWAKWPQFHIYDNIPFSEIKRNQNFKVTLDILILTYKNKDDLRATIQSLSKSMRQFINIVVINNGDKDDYSDIKKEFPYIIYHELDAPISYGAARQYAIDHSNGTYFMFVDAGNTFIPGGDKYILNTIKNNIFYDLYYWEVKKDNSEKCNLLGYVYRREFIVAHKIHFSDNNDSYGFMRAHELIIDYHNSRKIVRIYKNKMKVLITKTNFELVDPMDRGISCINAIRTTVNARITPYHILLTIANTMCYQYMMFIRAYEEQPEYMEEYWNAAKYFYDNCYDIYKQVGTKGALKLYQKEYLPQIIKEIKWNIPYRPNFAIFLKELSENDSMPVKYYD